MIKSQFDLLEKGSRERKKTPKPESVRSSMNLASSQTFQRGASKGHAAHDGVKSFRKLHSFLLVYL